MAGLQYPAGFLWGFVLLASLAGWGLAVTRLLGLRDDWGQAIARGIALSIAVGGWLNLTGTISAALLAGWIATGVALCGLLGRSVRVRRPHPLRPGWVDILAIAALLASYGTWLCLNAPIDSPPWLAYALNVSDDYQGYLLYPTQMLQTGSMGDDPFNDRRSMGGLGGEPFLQTFALLLLPLPYIHVVDPGIAHLAMAVALYSMSRRNRWPRPLAGSLLLLYLVIPTEAWNASAIGLPSVLLLSVFRTMTEERPARRGVIVRALAVGLPLAATLSLKYTVFPGTIVFVGLAYVARMVIERQVGRPMAEGLIVAGMTLALLMPWMIASHRACGSYLYPFLGEGYRAYTTIAIPHRQANRSTSQLVGQVLTNLKKTRLLGCGLATLGAIAAIARGACPRRRLAPTVAAIAGAIVTLGAFQVIFPLTAAHRYGYPFLVLLLILSFAAMLGRERPSGSWGRRTLRWLAWLLLIGMTARLAVDLRDVAPTAMKSAWAGLSGHPFVTDDEVGLYRRLQGRIPAGTRVLCVGDQNRCFIKPFLFDFSRNAWFVHDIPGCISPPPGIPLERGEGALVDYLRSQGIRYVVLHAEPETPEHLREASRATRGSDNWIASFLHNYANLTQLMNDCIASKAKLFDEGGFYVLDLGPNGPERPRGVASAGGAAGPIDPPGAIP